MYLYGAKQNQCDEKHSTNPTTASLSREGRARLCIDSRCRAVVGVLIMSRWVEYFCGQRVNLFIFLKDIGIINKERWALFRCHCGREFEDRIYVIKGARKKSCGCLSRGRIYYKGERVGLCYFIKEAEYSKGRRYGVFECGRCGDEFTASISRVKTEHTQTCGCLSPSLVVDRCTTHGLRGSQLYAIWISIRGRCNNKKNKAYLNYGGRGIRVCEEWEYGFKSFYDYVTNLQGYDENIIGIGKDKLTLDRICNNGNYEPGNLRLADRRTQALNQRRKKPPLSGYTGVYKTKSGKYFSMINVANHTKRFGLFLDKKRALEARNGYIIENGLLEYPIQKWRG